MFGLTPEEQSVFYPLAILTIAIPILNFLKKDPAAFFSPMTLISLIMIYYTVSGPLIAISMDNTWYRLTDHRPYFFNGWLISLLGFTSILVGFNLSNSRPTLKLTAIPESRLIKKYGKNTFFIGFIMLLIVSGLSGITRQINFTEVQGGGRQGYSGAFVNYLEYGINFFITAATLLLISFLKNKKWKLWLLIVVLVAVAIYLNMGFRYRLVLLGYAMFSAFYFYRRKKPNPIFIASLTVVGITIMGFVGSTRNYMAGLNLDKAEQKTQEEYFLSGFEESAVFMTTGLLVEEVPERVPRVGWDPIIQTLVFPIPRMIWPEKPSGDYLNAILEIYGGGQLGTGAAVLNFGEYYLAFGWFGVVIGSILVGYLAKRFWLWFLVNRNHPLAIVFYSIASAYFYVIISRGYLPQVVFLFFYTVFPAWVIIWLYRRKHEKKQSKLPQPVTTKPIQNNLVRSQTSTS